MAEITEAMIEAAARRLRLHDSDDHWNDLAPDAQADYRRCAKEALKAAMRAAEGYGWRTMETAPPNRTRALLVEENGRFYVAEFKHGKWEADEGPPFLFPTHWRPLPSPPNSACPSTPST